jgi:hypothetical protein
MLIYHNKYEEFVLAMLSLKSTDCEPDGLKKACTEASEFGIDTTQLEYLLTLTPSERVRRHDAALALVRAARRAGIKYYGFDPRSPEASQ